MKKTLPKFLAEFQKIAKREKLLILAILVGSFFLGIALSLGYRELPKLLSLPTSAPSPTPTPLPRPASLSLTSDTLTPKVWATFSATISLSSPDQGVEAADFVVNFDPIHLKVATVESKTFFKLYPQKIVEKDFVKISGVASFINNTFLIPKGQGDIASITFQTLSATPSTAISFDQLKTIVASGGKNILERISDLVITIK